MMKAPVRGCGVCPFNSNGVVKIDPHPTCLVAGFTNDGPAQSAMKNGQLRAIDANADDWCPIKGDGIQVYRD